MRRQRRGLQFLAIILGLSLVAAGCGGDDDEPDAEGTDQGTDDGEEEEEAAGGSFSAYVGQDPSSLTPTDCTDSECSKILNSLFTGLVEYDAETSDPLPAIQESIESDDNVSWTITISDEWTFHDGTPVTAQSFVDAWNYGANGENAQGGSYFFERFAGYEDLQCETDDDGACTAPPAATELSGLSATDDTTIEVELTEAFSQFPIILGYTVFYPLPEVFFDDPEAFNEQPVGNGPYQMAGPWDHDVAVFLERYEDYIGDDAGNADEIEMRIYADIETAYNDALAGNLDIHDSIPPEQLANLEDDFGDRQFEREISSFTYLGFPTYDERFSDPLVRQAFSLAIDRQPIIDAIFNGAFTPAKSLVSPVVVGSREDACEYCEYDPERAADLLEQAGGFEGTLEFWFNSGSGHDQWVEAAANQIRQNLGITDIAFREAEFAEYLDLGGSQGLTGPFRLGWGMDYPSPQNYLEPLYTEASFGPAGSNYTFYADPAVDDLIAEGNAADSIDEGVEFYQQAEDIILEAMPVIPMWFGLGFNAYSERVDNVISDAYDRIQYEDVEVVE